MTALLILTALLTSSCTPGGNEGAVPTQEGTSSNITTASADQGEAQKLADATSPWALAPLPDGRVLFTERDTGKIKLLEGSQTREIGTVDGVDHGTREGGLLGLALSPDFEQDKRIFVYLTTASGNRIVSMRADLETGSLGPAQEVLTGIPRANNHNGGRIKFGPDGFLYIGTGDAQVQQNAQDRQSLAGKILRITEDGRPAPGNPFGDSAVYSLGHRNVQGFAWDTQGRLWASEFGPSVDDELNVIEAGGNYGWPDVTGAPGDDRYQDAKIVWPSTAEASPSGIAALGNTIFVGALRGERLWQVGISGVSASITGTYFTDRQERIRDVATVNGLLLFATDEGESSGIYSMTIPG